MFGIALRTYHRRLARLSDSQTVRGKSLWEAVLLHVQQHGPLPRSGLLQRFAREDEATLRAVLLDLADTGLLRVEGRDDAARLHAAEAAEDTDDAERPAALDALVLVALHRAGAIDLDGLKELPPGDGHELEAALARLTQEGLVTRKERAGEVLFECETYAMPIGNPAG